MSSLPRFPIILDRVKSTLPDRAQSSVSLSASQQSGAARGIFSVHISQNPGQKGQSGALTWPEWQNQSVQDGIFRRSSVAGTHKSGPPDASTAPPFSRAGELCG